MNREAHVPAICEFYGIPYSGSDPLTLSLCLDKARTKETLAYHGVPHGALRCRDSTMADLDRAARELAAPALRQADPRRIVEGNHREEFLPHVRPSSKRRRRFSSRPTASR